MVSPELVSRFQGIAYGLWAKGCYTEARRGQEFYTETIYTLLAVVDNYPIKQPRIAKYSLPNSSKSSLRSGGM